MNTGTVLTAMLPEHLLLLGIVLLIVLEIGARKPREFLTVTLATVFAAAFASVQSKTPSSTIVSPLATAATAFLIRV